MKNLLIALFFIINLNGLWAQDEGINLIMPHPQFMNPNFSYIGETHAITSVNGENGIVYCIYHLEDRKLIYSDIIPYLEDDSKYTATLVLEGGEYSDEMIDLFFSDEYEGLEDWEVSSDYKMLNDGIRVESAFENKKQHIYWIDEASEEVVFSSRENLMSSFVGEHQAYNYLILSYGDPETGKITSSSYINLSTGEFSEFQKSKWNTRYSLAHYIRDSVVYGNLPYGEHGNYFENYTQYASWNQFARLYYRYEDEELVIDKLTPMTVYPAFFEENGWYEEDYRNYEIISAYNHKVTYKDISSDFNLYNIEKLKKEILFWNGNIDKPEERKVKLVVSSEGIPIFLTPDNYYFSTKDAEKILSFEYKGEWYDFEQFDLKFNRPDIILERLGWADSELINAYRKAYEKRLRKMGYTEEMLKADFHLPELRLSDESAIPGNTKEDEVEIEIILTDEKYNLDRVNIWVNDVPVFGKRGVDLRDLDTDSLKKNIRIPLISGKNEIKLSVMNQAGAESYKRFLEITREAEPQDPRLFLVSIGVSEFETSEFNLDYAAKDAGDIKQLFESQSRFRSVESLYLTNKDFTKDKIEDISEFLQDADREDEVVIFFAGHGVLDADFDYYLATYNMNFNDPSDRGLLYEDLENVLDGINPFKKLLLIDACHSGEIDKQDAKLLTNSSTMQSGDINFRAVGNSIMESENSKTATNLMREVFTDLRKGTGTTVISSSGGFEYSIESGKWKNGLFTYSLLQGVESEDADLDGNGEILLSELKQYVYQKVKDLSEGRQQPTTRMENRSLDFVIVK